jgi:hypothetical protein
MFLSSYIGWELGRDEPTTGKRSAEATRAKVSASDCPCLGSETVRLWGH